MGRVLSYDNCKYINPILHTALLENHALTLKNKNAKYHIGESLSCINIFLSML
jgi:hypothetical protein